ncbi:hypothetical protein Dip510_000121 [Elusimicrobium posterum]|uniref:hypothetical protein n=1 Tax=Elusimicrobium posterum TaxID=3116653 RepID=UPI003C720EA1
MKKILSITLVLSLMFNIISPAALHANAEIGAFMDYYEPPAINDPLPKIMAHKMHTSISELHDRVLRFVISEGLQTPDLKNVNKYFNPYEVTVFNQDLASIRNMGITDQVLLELEKSYSKSHADFLRKFLSETKTPAGKNYTVIKMGRSDMFSPETVKKVSAYYTAEATWRLPTYTNMAVRNGNIAKMSPHSGEWLTNISEQLLRTNQNLEPVIKSLYGQATPVEIENLMRLHRAYLNYVLALDELETKKILNRNVIMRQLKKITNAQFRQDYKVAKNKVKSTKAEMDLLKKEKAIQEAIARNIEAKGTSKTSKQLLRNLSGTAISIATIVTLTGLSLLISNSANAAQDQQLKKDLNDMTADMIKTTAQKLLLLKNSRSFCL